MIITELSEKPHCSNEILSSRNKTAASTEIFFLKSSIQIGFLAATTPQSFVTDKIVKINNAYSFLLEFFGCG